MPYLPTVRILTTQSFVLVASLSFVVKRVNCKRPRECRSGPEE